MKITNGLKVNIILFIILLIIPNTFDYISNSFEFFGDIQAHTEEQQICNELEKNLYIDINTDLRMPSNLNAIEYDTMLQGTNLYGLGQALEQAEKNYNVNGLYLMGLACLESGYGSSGYAINRNNLVGWGAYDNNPDNASYFESKDACILFVAQKLQQNYLTESGAYFEGYNAKSVDIHYCTDKLHANKIINIINNLKLKLN